MVYIHFPSNHTEEEITLQAKYQKLKRKVRTELPTRNKSNAFFVKCTKTGFSMTWSHRVTLFEGHQVFIIGTLWQCVVGFQEYNYKLSQLETKNSFFFCFSMKPNFQNSSGTYPVGTRYLGTFNNASTWCPTELMLVFDILFKSFPSLYRHCRQFIKK